MGGVKTNNDELQHIWTLRTKGHSFSSIAEKLDRSATFVAAKVRDMEKNGPPATVSPVAGLTPTMTTETEISEIVRSNLTRETKIKILASLV